MAPVPFDPIDSGHSLPLIAEANMFSDSSASAVPATVVQASTVFYDTPATLDKAERLLAEAASYGSQLVVFPEAFVGGYPAAPISVSPSAIARQKARKSFASVTPPLQVDELAATWILVIWGTCVERFSDSELLEMAALYIM